MLDGGMQLSLASDTTRPFLAPFYAGQTAGRIKMPLGTAVDHAPGDIVLNEDRAPPKGAQQPPLLSAHVYCAQTVAHLRYCWALLLKYSNA